MAVRSNYYAYIYFRPDGSPCYVGKGCGRRWLAHEKDWNKRKNKELARVVADAGGELPKVKIRENLTNAEACEIEIAFIAAIGREKHGGPLVNQTDGGEGTKGSDRPKSPEHKEAIRLGNLGKKRSAEVRLNLSLVNVGNKNASGKRSDEVKARMSAIQRGEIPTKNGTFLKKRPFTEKQIEAAIQRSPFKKGHTLSPGPHSDETKVKIGKGNSGKKRSLEVRRQISENLIGNKNRLGGRKYLNGGVESWP